MVLSVVRCCRLLLLVSRTKLVDDTRIEINILMITEMRKYSVPNGGREVYEGWHVMKTYCPQRRGKVSTPLPESF